MMDTDPCPLAGKMRIRKKLEKQFSGKNWNLEKTGKIWKILFSEEFLKIRYWKVVK